jgi:uncharacterized membrane protein HdeD (DUF308 family)
MENTLVRKSWTLLLRGLIAIIFGVSVLAWPGMAFRLLLITFGSYALIAGVFTLIAAYGAYGPEKHSWSMVFEGVIGIAVGIVALTSPIATIIALVLLVGIWAVFIGIMEVIAGVRFSQMGENRTILVVGGILSLLFGLLIMRAPIVAGLAVTALVGIYLVFFGLLIFSMGLMLKKASQEITEA